MFDVAFVCTNGDMKEYNLVSSEVKNLGAVLIMTDRYRIERRIFLSMLSMLRCMLRAVGLTYKADANSCCG